MENVINNEISKNNEKTINDKNLPLFKPFEMPKNPSNEFLKALEERKKMLKNKMKIEDLKPIDRLNLNTPINSSQLKGIVIDDTLLGRKVNVLNETENDSDNDTLENISLKDLIINESNEINKVTWKEPQKLYYQRATPPDIVFEENKDNYQNKYSAGSTYEWNIDGASEQKIINTLNQMIMFSNTNKTLKPLTKLN